MLLDFCLSRKFCFVVTTGDLPTQLKFEAFALQSQKIVVVSTLIFDVVIIKWCLLWFPVENGTCLCKIVLPDFLTLFCLFLGFHVVFFK